MQFRKWNKTVILSIKCSDTFFEIKLKVSLFYFKAKVIVKDTEY